MLLKICTASMAAVILAGCNVPVGSDGTNGNTSELTVTAVDGYITGATVKDQQGNTAYSNGDGTYSFVKTPIYPIQLTGGTLLDTGDAFSADIITGSDDAHMYATSGLVISPITTLLTTITNNKATTTLDSTLSAKLASMMGVTEAELLTDFVASENVNLAKITQVIHLMAQEPGLYADFKTNLGSSSDLLFAGVSAAAMDTMDTKVTLGDLSAIKQTVYNQIISDVSAYTGTAAGLEAGIDANKSMLENIATIEAIGGDIGSDIISLQTDLALAEIAGSADSTKTLTAAQLTALGVSSTVTDNADSVTLMADVIRQSTTTKYDTKAEVVGLETHINNFVAIDTQSSAVTDVNLLAAYKVILDDTSIKTYKQPSLAALTNSTSAVTANTVSAIKTLLSGVADIAAPVLTVTAATLNENAGTGQTLATAAATFATGSQLDVYSLESTGDYTSLSINAATGVVTVNADPDYETKSSYVFTVKATSVLTADTSLAVGDHSVQTTAAITNVADLGISRVVYSYGAEDAQSAGGTDAQTDSDNQLIITFNAAVDTASLAPEKFSIGSTPLGSSLTATYDAANKTYTITVGATGSINVASGSESTLSVTGVTINSSAFDTGFTSKAVEARTGITHNNLSYNTVKSPDTAKYWLDRHLGATQVATSSTDTASYGDLYQWGRLADGHQVRSPLTNNTSTRATSITPANDNFITNSATPYDTYGPYDWIENNTQDSTDVDDSGALRSAFLAKIDGTGICPTGFRVPTEAELVADTISATTTDVTDSATAFSSFLKLPVAGLRDRTSGALAGVGSFGVVWSSTASGSSARDVAFIASTAGVDSESRADGASVRCLKD